MTKDTGLVWYGPDLLDTVEDGEVILISHSRDTWIHKTDSARNNCVVVTRRGYRFTEFGTDGFNVGEIAAWARFNPPPADLLTKWPHVYLRDDYKSKGRGMTLVECLAEKINPR